MNNEQKLRDALESLLTLIPRQCDKMNQVQTALAALALPVPEPDVRLVELEHKLAGLLDHATCGLFSKTGYSVDQMQSMVDDRIEKERREAFEEGKDDALASTPANEAPLSQVVTWISVEERLPEKKGTYTVWINNNADISTWGKAYFQDGEFVDTLGFPPVTHWALPLKSASELAGGAK